MYKNVKSMDVISRLLTGDLQKSYSVLYFRFCPFYAERQNFIKFSLSMWTTLTNNSGKFRAETLSRL